MMYYDEPKIREQEPEKDKIICNKCGKHFSDQDKANLHMKSCGNPYSKRTSGLLYAIGAWMVPYGSLLIAAVPGKYAPDFLGYLTTTFPLIFGLIAIPGAILLYKGAKNHQKIIFMKHGKTLSWEVYVLPPILSVFGYIGLIGWIRRKDNEMAKDFVPLYYLTISIIFSLTVVSLFLLSYFGILTNIDFVNILL